MARRALMKGSALLVGLLLLGSVAWAQEITFSGSGCAASLRPDAPRDLRAEPGDGYVVLTWRGPANGACVDEYQVTAVPLGSQSRALGAGAPQTTRQFKLRVEGLQNGQEYRFTVRAFARRSNGGGESSVDATPREPHPTPPPATLCSRLLPPSAPTDLKVSNIRATSLTLCFGPPANYGCADEYRVNVRQLSASRAFGAAPLFWSFNAGGCVTIDKLQPGTAYAIDVQAWSNAWQRGATASIQARTAAAA